MCVSENLYATCSGVADEEYFSDKASEVLMELTSGKMLQGQVIGRGDDSFCYVHLYQVSGHSVSSSGGHCCPGFC